MITIRCTEEEETRNPSNANKYLKNFYNVEKSK